MTSREQFGRLAHAAYCDMAGRPFAWSALGPLEQAAWMHAAVAVRDRLALGMAHAYRPDEQEESPMAAAPGNETPRITETDDAEQFTVQRNAGNTDVKWTGSGPAPDAEPESKRVEREQREREQLAAQREQGKNPAERAEKTQPGGVSRSNRNNK